MATSAEIAQQISDQNNWFMQQQAVSAQVGVNPGAYGGGMGSWNAMAPRGSPAMQAAPGQSMPGAFSYGGTYGYGAGNRMGAVAAGGVSALPFVGSMLGGSSPMFNPAAGYSMARGAGMGMAGAGAAATLMALPVAIAAHGIQTVAGGMGQQAMANQAVGNYGFANSASMTGQGFSRQDGAQIGARIRELGKVTELMTSFEEISRILPQLKQMGTMNGVRDASEFGRRMKEAISSIRDVSKVIGSTMEEATQFFAHSQRVGFFGRKDQLVNALNTRITQSITGMDQSQVMAMQEQGAAFGTAVGGSRKLGSTAINAAAQRIGLAMQGNEGLRETVANITGKTGAEGIGDAAGMLTNFGMRVAGTGPGRFMLAGFMKTGENGEVGIDSELMQRHLRGEVSMDEIRRRGSKMMGDQKNVIAFEANQTKLGQQFATQGGGEAMLQLLGDAVGTDSQAAKHLLQSQYGATEEQADLIGNLLQANAGGMGDQRRQVAEMIKRQAQRREASAGGVTKRLGKRMSNTLEEPLKEVGASMHAAIGSWFDEIITDWQNDIVIEMSKDAKKEFSEALTSGDKQALKKMMSGGLASGGASFTSKASGWLRSTELGAFVMRGDNDTGRSASAELELSKTQLGAISEEDVNRRAKWLNKGGMSLQGEDEQYAAGKVQTIMDELSEKKEYREATPQKKKEMLLSAIGSDARTQAGIASLNTRGGTGGVDAATYLLGAGNKGRENLEDMFSVDEGQVDVATVAKNLRDSKSDMMRLFGDEAGNAAMSSDTLRSALSAAFDGKNEKSAAVRRAIRSKDIGALSKLTGGKATLTADQMDLANTALDKESEFVIRWGDSTKEVLGKADAAQGQADQAARTEAMRSQAGDVSSSLKNFSGDLGTAMGGLATSLGKGDTVGFNSSIDAIVKAYDAMPDGEEKSKALANMPAVAKMAISRKGATSSAAAKISTGMHSIAEIAKKTNLSEAEIKRTFKTKGDSLWVDEGVRADLSGAAARSGAGAGVMSNAEARQKEAKETQQMVMMKTMTEALLAIAKNTPGVGKNLNQAEEAFRANDNAANGKSPPDNKTKP